MHTSPRAKLFSILKGVVSVAIFALFVAIFSDATVAQTVTDLGLGQAQNSIGLGSGNLTLMIARILRGFFALLGIVAVGLIIWGGVVWMTAGGAEEKVVEAKKIIRNAAIGLGIILSSFAIAQFAISAILGGINGGGGNGGGDGSSGGMPPGFVGGGELGQTIEYVVPTPGANDVSRDTSIVVQFKKKIVVSSLLKNPDSTTAATVHGDLNTDSVKVYQTKLGVSTTLTNTEVSATLLTTTENGMSGGQAAQIQKTMLVISPKPGILLGSPNENIGYSVALGGGIQQDDPSIGVKSLFTDPKGYTWSFTVGTKVDLEPPKILNVYPSPGSKDNYTNAILTVNFSKPMMPSTILDSTNSGLQVLGKDGVKIEGTWNLANLASSAEFRPNNPCGKSACGDQFYCLPQDSLITVRAVPAVIDATRGTPKSILGGLGLMSLNQNSFDGNGNGTAEGPTIDTVDSKFEVGSKLDTEGPGITAHTPEFNGSFVDALGTLSMTFNEPILMSSIGGISLVQPTGLAQYYYPSAKDLDGSGNEITKNDALVAATKVLIDHAPFIASTTSTVYSFMPRVDEKLKDRQNNCYVPGIGLGSCVKGMASPYCCNGVVTANPNGCAVEYSEGK